MRSVKNCMNCNESLAQPKKASAGEFIECEKCKTGVFGNLAESLSKVPKRSDTMAETFFNRKVGSPLGSAVYGLNNAF